MTEPLLRNPDGTVNLNMPSITIDIEDVTLESSHVD